jgi:hypothetical protein
LKKEDLIILNFTRGIVIEIANKADLLFQKYERKLSCGYLNKRRTSQINFVEITLYLGQISYCATQRGTGRSV